MDRGLFYPDLWEAAPRVGRSPGTCVRPAVQVAGGCTGMEPRPLIGITSHLEPARWGDWVREAVVSPASYARAVHRAGGLPVVLPPIPGNAVTDLVRGLGGLILSAGGDVHPQLYGGRPDERTGDPD